VFSLGGNLLGARNYRGFKCDVKEKHDWDPPGVLKPGDVNIPHPIFNYTNPGFVERSGRPLLRYNGGNTCTVALKPGSPAYDNAWTGLPGTQVFACETYDQRWAQRGRWTQRGGAKVFACDIGAYEWPVASPDQIGVTCPDQ
jgi:hypothetical protein